jgi:hypothetical protein
MLFLRKNKIEPSVSMGSGVEICRKNQVIFGEHVFVLVFPVTGGPSYDLGNNDSIGLHGFQRLPVARIRISESPVQIARE